MTTTAYRPTMPGPAPAADPDTIHDLYAQYQIAKGVWDARRRQLTYLAHGVGYPPHADRFVYVGTLAGQVASDEAKLGAAERKLGAAVFAAFPELKPGVRCVTIGQEAALYVYDDAAAGVYRVELCPVNGAVYMPDGDDHMDNADDTN